MAADENDSRLLLSQELEAIRSKIVRGELVLFVGEQVSTLVTPENQSPSLDEWWQIVNHPSEASEAAEVEQVNTPVDPDGEVQLFNKETSTTQTETFFIIRSQIHCSLHRTLNLNII